MARDAARPARGAGEDRDWGLVAAAFLLAMVGNGLRFAGGPLVAALEREPGYGPGLLAGTVGAAALLYGACMALAGRLADRWGTRPVLVAGGLLLAAALAAAGLARAPALFAVAYAGVASAGFAAVGPAVLAPAIGARFRRRLGLAMTFLSSGSMAGIAVMSPVMAALVERWGWRGALLAAAAAVGVLAPAAAWRMPGRPPAAPTGPAPAVHPGGTGAAAAPAAGASRTAFGLLAASFFTCGFSMNLVGAYGVPMLADHGFHPVTAGLGVGLLGLTSIAGSLLVGAAADRFGRARVLAGVYVWRALAFLGLTAAAGETQLYALGVAGGLAWAGSMALTSALTAELFGAGRLGGRVGLLFLVHQLGGALAAATAGWGLAAAGSYVPAFWTASALLVLGAAAAGSVRRPAVRMGAAAGG